MFSIMNLCIYIEEISSPPTAFITIYSLLHTLWVETEIAVADAADAVAVLNVIILQNVMKKEIVIVKEKKRTTVKDTKRRLMKSKKMVHVNPIPSLTIIIVLIIDVITGKVV